MINRTTQQFTSGHALLPVLASVILLAAGWHMAACAEPATTAPAAGPFAYVGTVEGIFSPWQCYTPFSRDGAAVLTGREDGTVRVWDTRTLKPLTDPLPHPGRQWYQLSADGSTVFTAGGNEVRFWDVATSKLVSMTAIAGERLALADASADGTRFVTVGLDELDTVRVWHAGAARAVALLRHKFPVLSAEFDPSGGRIVTHERVGTFHVWDAETGRAVCPPITGDDESFRDGPYQARFDPVGRRLVVPRKRGFAVADLATGRVLAEGHWPDDQAETARVRFGGDG